MVSKKESKRIFRLLLNCLAFGTILLVSSSTGLAAKPEPIAPMQQDAIEILDQSNTPISNLDIFVDIADPLFPNGQTRTIRLRSRIGRSIRITEVKFFDRNGVQLLTNPGITLTPNPVGQTLPADGTPLTIILTPTGISVRPGLVSFPISGGRIDFVGEILGSTIGIPTTRSLFINVTITPSVIGAPTLSQWGLIIMFLLLSATGLAFLLLKHPGAVLSSGPGHRDIVGTHPGRIFDFRTFSKVLAVTLGLVIVGAGLVSWIFGSISAIDLGGSLISGAIVAFMTQLLILYRR